MVVWSHFGISMFAVTFNELCIARLEADCRQDLALHYLYMSDAIMIFWGDTFVLEEKSRPAGRSNSAWDRA